MSKDEYDTNLRFGQGILIQGYKDAQNDIGLLTTKGFADPTAKYETYKDFLYFKNYRNAIFQILPASNFEISDELRKIQQISPGETPNTIMLKARAKSQKVQFDLNIENKHKQLVCFGNYVIFKHIDSQTYLSGTIRPSSGKNGAFSVEVTHNLSESLIFQLLPFRSFEDLGMPIPIDSPILLKNHFNNGFLTFEKITGLEDDFNKKRFDLDRKMLQADKSYRIPVKTASSQSKIYDCVTHFFDLSVYKKSVPMPWKFVLHVNDVINDSLIQHDIVYFQHTANNGVLSTQGKEIILKQLKGQTTSEIKFYQCLWQIEKHDECGDDAYILRHLMSGMTLGVILQKDDKKMDGQKDIPTNPQLFDISEQESDPLGVVKLRLAKKSGNCINSGQFINICWGQACLDIKKSMASEQECTEQQNQEGPISIALINQQVAKQQEYNIKKIQFTLDISKNCFVIMEIEDQLKKEVLFALSFHSKIIQLREDLKWGKQEAETKVTYLRIMQMTEKIKEIKDFLKKCSRQQADLEEIHPIEKRQMICKDLGISQLLFELLYYMNKNNQLGIFIDKINQREKFRQLYSSIYQVITELIRDNNLFKMHISKWIMFIINDVISSDNDESRLNLIKEFLKNNEFFVNNFINADLISYLVDKMLLKGDYIFEQKKYIQIFRLFCIVGNKVNTQNQTNILREFLTILRTKQNGPIYQISFTREDQNIMIQAAIDKNKPKKRKFGDYYKISYQEYKSAWWYFVQYTNLIADMAKGRNKTVEKYIETMYTFDIISQLFEHCDLHQAEVPITRLLHYLYVESQHFYPIERQKRIQNWNTLHLEQPSIMKSQSHIRPWEPPYSNILKCLLSKLKGFGPINPSEVQKNDTLFHILDFVEQTLNLGFWKEKSQVKLILQIILNILKPHESILQANYENVKTASHQNSLMIKCKMECIKIISSISDYDIDLGVNIACKKFYSFKFPEVKNRGVDFEHFMDPNIQNQLAKDFLQSIPEDTEPLIDSQIISYMIQLSKYNNPLLTSSSISIIRRVLLTKSKLIQDFSSQVFICAEEQQKLSQYIQERKKKFFTLEDNTLINVTLLNQNGNYVMVYQDDKQSGIMQDIYMISQLVKNENSITTLNQIKTLDSSKTYKELGGSRLINFTCQRTSSDLLKQKLLDAQNIHWKIMTFLLNCKNIPTEELAAKLLHLSYMFMASLIWNYQRIKPKLIVYVPHLINHIAKNVGAIDFLRELYDNNKSMLYNEAEIVKLIKKVCITIEGQDNNSYYKSKLLDFFRFLIYCNGRSLKFNQIQILKIMQDDSYTKIIIKPTVQQIRTLVDQYLIANQQKGDRLKNQVKMSPQLTYMTTYFQIMLSLIDDQNTVNIGKLLKKFPFDLLINMLKQCRTCWPLKRNIRGFLNRLHYFRPQVQTNMKTIINEQLFLTIQDLNLFIDVKCKINIHDYQMQKFQNPVRFSYMESYLYLNLEEVFFTLYMLTTNQFIQFEMKKYLHSLNNPSNQGSYNFIRICQRLGFIKNYFASKKNVYSTSFIKFLLKKFQIIISEFDDNIYLPGIMPQFANLGRAPTKPQKEKARKGMIEKILQGDIETFYVQGSQLFNEITPLVFQLPEKPITPKEEVPSNKAKLRAVLVKILRRKKRQFKNLDQEIDYKMQKLVSAIKLSPQTQDYLLKDYIQKLSGYAQGEQIFNFITVIIEMNSINPNALPQGQKQFFLEFITGIVEQNNNKKMEKRIPIDEWQPSDWQQSSQSIMEVQGKLKSCQLGKFITELLKQNITENIQLANAILMCGIAYLLGGNSYNQKDIIEEISADVDNRVMRNLDALISKLGQFILKNIDQGQNTHTKDDLFSITTIDNWDFYDVPKKYVTRKNVFQIITTDQLIYYKECIITYRRAFKFLQLLCQSNSIVGKNFIRQQPKKLRQSNFILIATKELRNIFQKLNSQIADIPIFLLDFLLEVTQIPVKVNQQTLMNLNFFQDLCQMQIFFSKDNNLEKRGFGDSPQLLNRIYFKSIQIILSNFQGNDPKTYSLLDSKLDPKFLTKILTGKLTELQITSKEDFNKYLDHRIEINFDQDMTAVLNIIIIFLKIYQELGESSRLYTSYMKLKQQNESLFQSLQSSLLSIEINDHNDKRQTVFFPKLPVFDSLSGNLRDYIMSQVKRKTHRDKIISLLGYIKGITDKINSSYTLKRVQNISQSNMNSSFSISALMSVIICIYMMQYYNIIIQYGQADFTSSRLIGLGRFFLSLIQLSMSLVYGYFWLRFRIWQKPKKISRQIQKVRVTQQPQHIDHKDTWFTTIVTQAKSYIGWNKQIQKDFSSLKANAESYRMALYVGVSIVGTFFYPPLFFMHIIDIFCNFPILGNIFRAITSSFMSILYVSLMGVVFVFVFCSVTFSNYIKDVYSDQTQLEEMCEGMLDCIMQLYVSGAIGQTMQSFQFFRFLFDVIYTIFFGMIFQNIISGIILGAFQTLRERDDQIQTDKKNKCYICNIQRQDLQKQGISFTQHTRTLHYLWNYVFYIYSLQTKSVTDFTGLEYHITKRYNLPDEDIDVSWIPLGDSGDFNVPEKLKEFIQLFETSKTNFDEKIAQIDSKVAQFNQIVGDYIK